MRIVIDRIEDGFAVAEMPDGSFKMLSVDFLPDCREGDVVDITVNTKETENRKKEVRIKLDSLFDNE